MLFTLWRSERWGFGLMHLMYHYRHIRPIPEDRGWRSARLKFACGKCVNDAALRVFIRQHATARSCSYCGSISRHSIAVHLNLLLRHLNARLRTEWKRVPEPPLDDCYASYSAHVIPTQDLLRDHLNQPIRNESLNRDVLARLLTRGTTPEPRYSLQPQTETLVILYHL